MDLRCVRYNLFIRVIFSLPDLGLANQNVLMLTDHRPRPQTFRPTSTPQSQQPSNSRGNNPHTTHT